jgi:hypothetical protein
MVLFVEKTWMLWWIFAVVVILYWFHKFSADTEPETLEVPSSREEVRIVPGQASTKRTDPPFVDASWF